MAALSDAQREAGWTIAKLGDIVTCLDHLRQPIKGLDRVPGPYPYYGASGVVDYIDQYAIDGKYLLISEDGENLRSRSLPIAFYAVGKSWVNNHAHIISASDSVMAYVKYVLNSHDVSAYLTGTTMPKLSQKSMMLIDIPLPPQDILERIAGILGSLDDKIEANTRLIQAMDSYKSTLFQAHLCSESEGETIKVSDVATLIRKNIVASDIDESMNYVALEHIPRHSLYSHEWTNSEGVMSNKSGFKVGDILFGKLRPYFHKVSIAAVDGIASTDILVLRPKPEFEVLAQSLLSSEDLIEYATQVSSGTRMPRASWKDIMNYEVTVKNVEILQESLSGFDTYSRALIHENKVLTETRDALVKRLIG